MSFTQTNAYIVYCTYSPIRFYLCFLRELNIFGQVFWQTAELNKLRATDVMQV